MLKNNLKYAIRNILNSKAHSIINILGLGIGFTCVIFISLYVYDEFTYDRYHANADRIYRVVQNWKSNDNITPWARTSAPLAAKLVEGIPEIEEVVRIRKNPRTDLLAYGDKKFNEDRLFFADSNAFKVFSFPVKDGNPDKALMNINAIMLTGRMARKYFGDEDPMGKILRYNNKVDLMVTGILGEIPANSHFVFDFLVTFGTLKDVIGDNRLANWAWFDHQTYVLLKEGVNPQLVEASFPAFMKNHAPEWLAERSELFMQPLTDIHLKSDLKDELSVNSKTEYSYILITIGAFILLMGCINFMNLATARYTSRSVEIGVRKVLGAHKNQLLAYYLFESVVMSIVAFGLALLFVTVFISRFNFLTGKQIVFFSPQHYDLIWPLLILTILVGLISGSYPSFFLSALKPVAVLKGMLTPGKASNNLRKILVVFQFSISMILIIATLIVSRQYKYFRMTNLGFQKEHVLVVPIKDRSQNSKYQTMIQQMMNHEGITAVSFASSTPGTNSSMSLGYKLPGQEVDLQNMATFIIDENFLSLYDLQLIEGRTLEDQIQPDSSFSVIINEAAVKFFELSDPIGQKIEGSVGGTIIGVVKDFNIRTLHHQMEPTVMFMAPSWFRYISIKVKADRITPVIDFLNKKWSEIYAGHVLEYSFLEDNIGKLYSSEQMLNRTINILVFVAVFIAGLGLVGLGSFTVEKRTKEIGIRKVMGSSSINILGLLYKDFFKITALAVLLAWPISYFLMDKWLQSFAHKIPNNIVNYITPIILMGIVIVISVGYQTLRAALANPSTTLRDE